MELKHNFYGVNFAPFPRRGVLNSETAHRSMTAMVEATAANWVILSPSGIQSGPYSEEIDWRTDATPTDEELCGAIRFAKQLGLQVALKPTVNCANGVWRARISFFDHDVPCVRPSGADGLPTTPPSRPTTRLLPKPKAVGCS